MEIAAATDDGDPAEVMKRASEWRGRGYVNAASMPDDRLAHTVIALRAEAARVRGEPAPAQEGVSAETRELVSGIAEWRRRRAQEGAGGR